MKIIGAILTIVFLAGIGYLIIRPAKTPVIENKTIVAFGDSLVKGYGATEGNDFVSVMSRDLGVPIENMGVSGDTTQAALARIDTVTDLNPGIVIMVIGGNDILRRIPISETRENIATMLSVFRAHGTKVILVGVRGGLLNDPYRDLYKSLAEEYDAIYVSDILSGLLGNTELMSDPIHPNDAGYDRIAKRLAKVIEPLLK